MGTRKSLPDLLKGAAVLLMVQVHLMELFMRQEVFDSLAGKASLFLGGPPAAPVFMAVMGYFLARPSQKSRGMFFRGLKIILWGLLLNMGLNVHLLLRILFKEVPLEPLTFILGVDILFLAGMSLVVISGIRLLFGERIIPYLMVLVVVAFLGNKIPVVEPSGTHITYLLAYLGGDYPWSYFPLIPWLAYPLIGYIAFLAEKKGYFDIPDKRIEYWAGSVAVVFLFSTLGYAANLAHDLPAYYHHGIVYVAWVVCFLMVFVRIMAWLDARYSGTHTFRYLNWVGENVTSFYVFQWLLIGNLGTWLYKSQAGWTFFPWLAAVMGITTALVWMWTPRKKKDLTVI